MRILITGSREWTDREKIRIAILTTIKGVDTGKEDVTIIHGGAKGADRLAGSIALSMWGKVEEYLPDWNTHGKAAAILRNQDMVDTKPDICLAFPVGESRGTRDCMRRAEKAGIKVINYGDKDG